MAQIARHPGLSLHWHASRSLPLLWHQLSRPISGRRFLVLRGREEIPNPVVWLGQARGSHSCQEGGREGGNAGGLGLLTCKEGKEADDGPFNRLRRESWPGFEVLGNRGPLHCISLPPWSKPTWKEVTCLGTKHFDLGVAPQGCLTACLMVETICGTRDKGEGSLH